MTFYHGTQARFYYDKLDFSGYAEQVELSLTRALAEYRPLNATAVLRVPGASDAQITLTGGAMDDPNEEEAWSLLTTAPTACWAFLPTGDALGRPVYMGQATHDNQQRVVGDDIVRLPIAFLSMAGVDTGKVLRALAPGGTSPGANVDDLAPSTTGGVGQLIVTAVTGTLAVVIQHSVDGTTAWDPLVTFTGVTVPGSQAVEVATGVTIRRYLRVSWTGSGTWFAAFSRR